MLINSPVSGHNVVADLGIIPAVSPGVQHCEDVWGSVVGGQCFVELGSMMTEVKVAGIFLLDGRQERQRMMMQVSCILHNPSDLKMFLLDGKWRIYSTFPVY